jgi:hypothetical protein
LFDVNISGFRPELNYTALHTWLLERQWTPESIIEWQGFYNNAARSLIYGRGGNLLRQPLPELPAYKDLAPPSCHGGIPSAAIRESPLFVFIMISFFIMIQRIFS